MINNQEMENAYSIEKEKLQKMEDEIETQKDAFSLDKS
jgi:hypothetical protein